MVRTCVRALVLVAACTGGCDYYNDGDMRKFAQECYDDLGYCVDGSCVFGCVIASRAGAASERATGRESLMNLYFLANRHESYKPFGTFSNATKYRFERYRTGYSPTLYPDEVDKNSSPSSHSDPEAIACPNASPSSWRPYTANLEVLLLNGVIVASTRLCAPTTRHAHVHDELGSSRRWDILSSFRMEAQQPRYVEAYRFPSREDKECPVPRTAFPAAGLVLGARYR